jgi:GTP-binding protein
MSALRMTSITIDKPLLIAIVGRPNVGKSTLFNRLTGKWRSIVEDRPGITRDRIYGDFTIYGHAFRIMDTGGLNLEAKTAVEKKMSAQAEKGIAEADLILFVMDGRAGSTPLDATWVAKLRKIHKPKIFVVNKIDEGKQDALVPEFERLGIRPIVPISAEKQRNFSGLSQAILDALKLDKDGGRPVPKDPEPEIEPFEPDVAVDDAEAAAAVRAARRMKLNELLNVAIIGRPNVGKSTLLNALIDEERCIVDDAPGTTRDPIHTYLEHAGQKYCLIDTAGIRKRAKTVERVEKFSVVNALSVVDQAHVVLLVMDGVIGPAEQDAHVAGYAFEKQRAIIVVVNKWDEGSKTFTREQFKEKLELKMNYLSNCPLIFISAKTRKNLHRVFEAVASVRAQFDVEVKTGELNRTFKYITEHHPLPTYRGRDIKMFYATQISQRPPGFMIFCSEPDHVHFTYKRYLVNALRESFGLKDVPVRLIFRKR